MYLQLYPQVYLKLYTKGLRFVPAIVSAVIPGNLHKGVEVVPIKTWDKFLGKIIRRRILTELSTTIYFTTLSRGTVLLSVLSFGLKGL